MFSEEDKIMMETLYWWGIPTLFRCKNDPDPKNCDIADVISAAIESVGFSNVKIPEKSRLQAVKDLESYPDPRDSLP